MVISFSGIDGAGKTTQINLLSEYCEQQGIKYEKRWSKARGTPLILFLKNIVRKDRGMTPVQKSEYRKSVYNSTLKRNVLFVCSMLDLCLYWGITFRLLKLKYRKGLLILDRYIWDTFVEVSNEFNFKSLNKNVFWRLVKFCHVKPDVSILLYIPAEESFRRDVLKEEISLDTLDFKKKKTDMYMALKTQGCWDVCIDTMSSIEQSHGDILSAISFQE